jgi:hypothetical protein
VHIGRGYTHLLCFCSILPVLNLAISVMVAYLEICRDNKIRRNYSWGLLAPHVEIYYLAMIFHNFLSKRLEFRTTHKISQYIDNVHPLIMNPWFWQLLFLIVGDRYMSVSYWFGIHSFRQSWYSYICSLVSCFCVCERRSVSCANHSLLLNYHHHLFAGVLRWRTYR